MNERFCGSQTLKASFEDKSTNLVGDDCVSFVPAGIIPSVQLDCSTGSPLVGLNIFFEGKIETEDEYTCELRPSCTGSSFRSWLVCHTSISYLEPKGPDGKILAASVAPMNTTPLSMLFFILSIVCFSLWDL